MKKIFIITTGLLIGLISVAPASPHNYSINSDDKNFPSLLASDESPVVNKWVDSLYNTMRLDSLGLQRNIFFYACKGYEYLLSKNKLNKTGFITICDYSQPSNSKRLYVIDIENAIVLFNTYVSHGKNSGTTYATDFSNRAESHKSSLGFMVTGETYNGKAGYSLHLDGMEKGFNDKVRARDIVMHGSSYVNSERADEGTMMGRSFGCPAVPYSEHWDIIDKIKDGSCFFIYSTDAYYSHISQIMNAHFNWPVAMSVVAENNISTTQSISETKLPSSSSNAISPKQ